MSSSVVTETFPDVFSPETSQLIEAIADIAILVNSNSEIEWASQSVFNADEIDCTDWVGKNLETIVTLESIEKAKSLCEEARNNQAAARPGAERKKRQLNHTFLGSSVENQRSAAFEYQALSIGSNGQVLLLGRDLSQMSTLQSHLIRAQQALEYDYDRFRQTESRYRQLFQLAMNALLVIDAADLVIVDANKAARATLASLGGSAGKDLVGKAFPADFRGLIQIDENNQIKSLLREILSGRLTGKKSILLAHMSESLILSFEGRDQAGNIILRIGSSDTEDQLTSNDNDQMLERLLDRLPDALVVTDGNGVILKANQSFFEMTELTSREAMQNSTIDRWLNFGGLTFSALNKTLSLSNGLRLMLAEIMGEYGTKRQVEVSITHMVRDMETRVGLLLRDVGPRASAVTPQPKPVFSGDSNFDNISDLIGQMPLKDIVRETTDVIEQMCLEAALSATQGNRASAAEVLGLSRQSLYVKMRRFGIDKSQDN